MKQDVKKIIKDSLSANKQSLLEPECKAILSGCGLPIPRSVLIKKKKEFETKAKKLTPPYVLKVVSQDILHKSDIGGVVTDIKNIKELNNVWTKMVKNISHKMPTARIDGFLLEEMSPKGVEVIIGGLRDTQFGPVVMIRTGYLSFFLLRLLSYDITTLNIKQAIEMIREVK